MKINRAEQQVHHIPRDGTALENAEFCQALLCSILQRTGIEVLEFSQKDFDAIHGMFILEGEDQSNGDFLIKIAGRKELNIPDS